MSACVRSTPRLRWRRLVAATVAVGSVAVGSTACGSSTTASAQGKLATVATTPILSDFLRQVGGDRVEVYDVIRPNVDPHDYEPSPADLVRFSSARVVVKNGVGLEPWLDDAVSSSGSDATIVDASSGISLRHGAEEGHDEHAAEDEQAGGDQDAHEHAGTDDPHIWQDPHNAEQMVRTIRDALVAADPEDADVYRSNAATYLDQLAALDRDVVRAIATVPVADRKVVTNHDAFGYYLARYGLTFVGSVIPSFDTSAELSGKALSDLVATIRAQRVRAVFSESSLPPRTAETVAQQAGVKVVSGEGSLYGDTLGPPGSSGDTYLRMVRHNTDVIVQALR